MNNQLADIGMIGMGVMGYSLLQNLADHGFSVAGLDTDAEKVEELNANVGDKDLFFTTDTEAFVQQLSLPRKIWIMVPAGKIVDAVIAQLRPLLSPGDLILDGGNSYFEDSLRREEDLAKDNIYFLGVGVSGGEEGARFGPSIMPGGARDSYQFIQPFLEAIAAKVGEEQEPCVDYLGKKGAGHYVKMVHNGIEYGLMHLISECYDVMHRGLKMDNLEMADVFANWNEGRLQSYLVEITRDILRKKDPQQTGEFLIDNILDTAKQKGTGKWTSQSALDLGVPVPTIDTAVMFRYLSARKPLRQMAGKWKTATPIAFPSSQKADLLVKLEAALYTGFVLTYAQGFELLKFASEEWDFELEPARIARIWRGGCIIRADLLNDFHKVFTQSPSIANLIFSDVFRDSLLASRMSLVSTLRLGIFSHISVPGFSSCLAYLDGYFSERLPANMIQAQRDYFGAHTYQRVDQSGTFHTDWNEPQ
ncbi:MAG: NADP-dependent phosphogluconate dehydrogenase [Bacteroidota bacterium]